MKALYADQKSGDLGKKILGFLLLLPLAVALSTAATGTNNYILLFVVAGIVFLSLLTDFRVGLTLIVLCSYFLSYSINQFHLSKSLFSLPYFLIVLMLIREHFFAANLLPVRTPINVILMLIIVFGVLSIFNGESSLAASMKGMMRHVGYPLFFLMVLMAEPDEKTMRQLVYAVLAIGFLQIPASGWQFLYYWLINPKDHGFRADHSSGLIGYSCGGHTAIFMVIIFCLILGFILVKGLTWKRAAAAGVTVIPIFLASARAGIIFFAIAALFMLLFAPLRRHIGMGKRVFVAAGLVAVMVGMVSLGFGGEGFSHVLDYQYMQAYSDKKADQGMGRLQVFDVVQDKLKDGTSRLIGLGPGVLTPTDLLKNPNSLIAQNPELFRNMTGYGVTALEIGFLGLVLFLAMYFRVYRFTRKFMKQIDDPFWEAVSLGFCGTIIVYVISTVYVDSWLYYPIPLTFWALAAAIYRVGIIKGIFSL